jgi:hypothetical protein
MYISSMGISYTFMYRYIHAPIFRETGIKSKEKMTSFPHFTHSHSNHANIFHFFTKIIRRKWTLWKGRKGKGKTGILLPGLRV